jgi:mRNA interferase RelE/StbE
MIVEFDKSFSKCLGKVGDKSILKKTESFIFKLETCARLEDISGIKKLQGHPTYYRYRLGDYRLGFELIDSNTVRLIILAHRKDVYKIFP